MDRPQRQQTTGIEKSDLEQYTGIPQGNQSREQYDYAVARAMVETATERLHKEIGRLERPKDDSPEELSRFDREVTAIEDRYKIGQLVELKRLAEDQLIAWADREMRKRLGAQRYKQIEECFRKKTAGGMKQKLVDICMQMPGVIR